MRLQFELNFICQIVFRKSKFQSEFLLDVILDFLCQISWKSQNLRLHLFQTSFSISDAKFFHYFSKISRLIFFRGSSYERAGILCTMLSPVFAEHLTWRHVARRGVCDSVAFHTFGKPDTAAWQWGTMSGPDLSNSSDNTVRTCHRARAQTATNQRQEHNGLLFEQFGQEQKLFCHFPYL